MGIVLSLVTMMSVLFYSSQAFAMVNVVNPWPARPSIISNGASGTISAPVRVGVGSNRAMLVAVAAEYSASTASPTFSATYGGQTVTLVAQSPTTSLFHIWVGVVNETKLTAAGANATLSVNNGTTANLTAMYVTTAVYAGVDQTTLTTGSNGKSTGIATAASITLTGGYPVAGTTGIPGMSLTIAAWNGQSSSVTGYTEDSDYTGTNFNLAGTFKQITAAGTETPVSTAGGTVAGAMVGVGLNPFLFNTSNTIATCGDCHSYPPVDGSDRNVPIGAFTGNHNKHSGTADDQYNFACSKCHYNHVTTTHSSGYKNISGTSLPGTIYSKGRKIAVTNSPSFGTCGNLYCHSSGRASGMGTRQYSSARWAGGKTTCLSCHGGRDAALGNPARSVGNFTLSTSHAQHFKYGATSMNCQICHSQTATDAATLKLYSGVSRHVNNKRDVIFSGLPYGTYTSYKSSEVGSGGNTKTCGNVSCHGGKSRNAWSNTTINTNNTCVHCHGVDGSTTLRADKYNAAPGWNGTGTSTDQVSVNTDIRVGAHFVHLSSVYLKKLKCNECHAVPSTPFEGTHMQTQRYNSQTLTFAQSSTAMKNSTAPVFTAGTAVAAARCNTTFCHGSNMPRGDTSGSDRTPTWVDSLTTGTPGLAECGRCHGNPPTFGFSSTVHKSKAPTTSCANCHGATVTASGAVRSKALHINGTVNAGVNSSGASACNVCHGNPPIKLSYGGYSGLTSPKTLALGVAPATVGAHALHQTKNLTCNTCHNDYAKTAHPDSKVQIFFRVSSSTWSVWNATSPRAPYGSYSGNNPTNGSTADTTSTTTKVIATANNSRNSCNVYCHGGWNGSNKSMNPSWTSGSSATACGACHGATAASLPKIGNHARHAGYGGGTFGNNTSGYVFSCTRCHLARFAGDNHIKGTVQVRMSTSLGNFVYNKTGATLSTGTGYRQYDSNKLAGDTPDGTCSTVYCHSSARAMGTPQYTTTNSWGTSTRSGCLACHGGRAGATGAYTASNGGFRLSSSHGQHLKYPAANMNCQMCHAKTAMTNAWTLKTYTGVIRHANGKRDVLFTDIAYGSMTSYKSTAMGSGANTFKCSNMACHGGTTRSAWSNTTVNTDNTCVHCHGTVGTQTSVGNSGYNRRFFAPGWNKAGTSTDGTASSNDIRVGSHFKHLSSAYMKSIKCNECHAVPSDPFSANHIDKVRFQSPTLNFLQSSSARLVGGGTRTTMAAPFSGYTNGTAVKAATCSSVYCHGNRLKNGDTGGVNAYRKPYWNYSAMVNYTDPAISCGRCHGNPPSSVTASHNGKTPTTSCSGCHSTVVDATGKIINKALHINGLVESTGHAFPYPGADHLGSAGTTPWGNCTGCHVNSVPGPAAYPVLAGVQPDCTGCHKRPADETTFGLRTPSGTSSCWDCHGASATDGRPNGKTFPNYSGSHTKHVVNQGMACATCHGPFGGGISDKRHGFSNRTAHTFSFVNVTSTTAQFKYTATGKGNCSNITCHPAAQWAVTKLQCNSCHGYDSSDSWTTTYGIEGIGAHVKHINYIKNRWNITLSPANDTFGGANMTAVCGVCHTVTLSDHSKNKSVNTRTINFGGSTVRQFGAGVPTYNGSSGTSSAANPKTCSNIDCHFLTTPIWMTY